MDFCLKRIRREKDLKCQFGEIIFRTRGVGFIPSMTEICGKKFLLCADIHRREGVFRIDDDFGYSWAVAEEWLEKEGFDES